MGDALSAILAEQHSVERTDQVSWLQRGLPMAGIGNCESDYKLRARAKISLHFRRSDLGQVWLIRLSPTAGITSYFEELAIEERPKIA